ncbi:MAG: methylmalonyl-CoA mutase family protein, partial [Vulcanimicrobiota bacterium]
DVKKQGGAVKAIDEGYVQQQIHESAYSYQKAMESGDNVVVGVNKFQTEEKGKFKILSIDPTVEKEQVDKLKAFKGRRDKEKVKAHLDKIKENARTDQNLMPLFIEAVKDGLTVGEISNAFRDMWGEYVDKHN